MCTSCPGCVKRRTTPKEVKEPPKPDPEKDPIAYYRSLRPQPSVRVIATGQEETEKIRPDKKKVPLPKNKLLDEGSSENESDDEDKVLKPDKPHEKTRLQDGALITNFEVQFEEEPEEIVYAGGIKGIRALRRQRDVFTD